MKEFLITVMFILAGAMGFSQVAKLSEVVPEAYYERLQKDGKIELIHEAADQSLVLLPKSPYAQDVVNGQIKKEAKQIPFNAEYLYIIPKNEGDDSVAPGVKANIDDVSKAFRSISKMKGMKYHFEKKKPEVLYKDTYMIASADSKEPIADMVDGSADGLVGYCFQDDNTYGKLRYKLSYKQNANTVFVEFHLVSPMSCMGVKAVDPENLKVNVIAIECEDSFLLYMGTDVAAKKIALVNVRKQITESMVARIDAIYRWFLAYL